MLAGGGDAFSNLFICRPTSVSYLSHCKVTMIVIIKQYDAVENSFK